MKKKQNITFLVLIFSVIVLSLVALKIGHGDIGQKINITEYLNQKQEEGNMKKQANLVKMNLDYQASVQHLLSEFLSGEEDGERDFSSRKKSTDDLIEKLLDLKVVKEQKEFHLELVVLLTDYSDVLSSEATDEVEQKNQEIHQFLDTKGWNI